MRKFFWSIGVNFEYFFSSSTWMNHDFESISILGCIQRDFYPDSNTGTRDEKVTTTLMLRDQSKYFRKLTREDQCLFEIASKRNGFSHQSPKCELEKLIACNDNQADMDRCLNVEQDYNFIPRCLHKVCRGCGFALASLLGFDPYLRRMVRLIQRKNGTNQFGNLLSTPYIVKKDSVFESHLYLDYDGVLRPEEIYEKMASKLQEHRSYWQIKLGSAEIPAPGNEMDMVKTAIESADKLVDVINKTKAVFLDDLESKIKSINTQIGGIREESKKNIAEALELFYVSEVKVQKTRSLLETLAKETIVRVNSMLTFLDKVQDDWEVEKIAKFMKYQAKKMTELIDRSLGMIKEAEELYMDVGTKLGEIQAKLEAFVKECENLKDSNSAAFKSRVKDIRMKVYIPCCALTLGAACPICVGILENEISKWKGALNELLAILNNNVNDASTLADKAKEQRERLQKEVASLLNWASALHVMSGVDYNFPEAEIFGFAEVRPDLNMNLQNLKDAASDYLTINADSVPQ